MRSPWISALLLAACSSSTNSTVDASRGIDASSGADGSGSGIVGSGDFTFDGDPEGLYWDATANTLYIADQQGNQILTWTDAGGFGSAAIPLPTAPDADDFLGGLFEEADGKTLLTPRFGNGTAGTMISIDSTTGSAATFASLDPTRRRLGVTIASDGTILDTYFVKTGSTTVGSVAVLDLTGSGAETDLITNINKPVGVVEIGGTVYTSGQKDNIIWSHPLGTEATDGSAFATDITGPDLMCAGPNNSMFAGSTAGVVYQIDSSGTVTTFQSGFVTTRGVAYDAVNKRLFVGEHTSDTATMEALHIFPVDQ